MRKLYIFGLIALACVVIGLAWAEQMSFTTYYLVPSGVYNQMQTNRLAVGDTNNSGGLDLGDQPNRDGDIRLKPQAGNPTTWAVGIGTTGQFSYSSGDDALYHFNGSSWVESGGGGGLSYTYYCFEDPEGDPLAGAPACLNSGGTRGYCPAGYQQEADLGWWGRCACPVTGQACFRPPGSFCGPLAASPYLVGRAFICSN